MAHFNPYPHIWRICGCWHWDGTDRQRHYLPLVKTSTHATILANATHTVLEQSFTNTGAETKECIYEFPLYDGVTVTAFTCTIGSKTLYGVVHERGEARAKYDAAVAQGQQAGLLEQDYQASDVFRTTLGNIPADVEVRIRIEYVGELKQDAGADALRLTIPSIIAPRYGDFQQIHHAPSTNIGSTSIIVDINLADGSLIKGIESPSHPIGVSMGTLSTNPEADPDYTKGSATLSLKDAFLDKDFVLLVKAANTECPRAVLEHHPELGYRALMTTLVPRFTLPASRPEIVIVADRSGSMSSNIPMLREAIGVLLHSMPVGVKFNICSFGSGHDFLWPKSKAYGQTTLNTALKHVDSIEADYGGTETLSALEGTINNRFGDIPTEIILVTDGDIRNQATAIHKISDAVKSSNHQIRLFALGIGSGVSHSLIEGLSRAGNGFAQAVQDGERMTAKVVRMLKGALSPHISDYTLEVAWGEEDDFELVEKVVDSLQVQLKISEPAKAQPKKTWRMPTISLFDRSVDPSRDAPMEDVQELPQVPVPNLLQAPSKIPDLFPFIRTTAYVLLSPSTRQSNPVAVILRGTSSHGPLELKIPITILDQPGTMVHSLAARKSVQDLEEGRGWLHEVTQDDQPLSKAIPSQFEDLVQREAVRLGETFQIASKWCSFVAVAADSAKQAARTAKEKGEETTTTASPMGDMGTHFAHQAAAFQMASSQMQQQAAPSSLFGSAMGLGMAMPAFRKLVSPAGSAAGGRPGVRKQLASKAARRAAPPPPPPSAPAMLAAEAAQIDFSDEDIGATEKKSPPKKRSKSNKETQNPFKSALVSVEDRTVRILGLQTVEGCWSATKQLAQLLGMEFTHMRAASATLVTALVINFLETTAASEKDTWELAVDKAQSYLETNSEDKAKVMDKAAAMIKQAAAADVVMT